MGGSRFRKASSYLEISFLRKGQMNRQLIPIIRMRRKPSITYKTQTQRFAKPVVHILQLDQTPIFNSGIGILSINRIIIHSNVDIPKIVETLEKLI
jgi:hypothetical protein